jgi:hypothetical protein
MRKSGLADSPLFTVPQKGGKGRRSQPPSLPRGQEAKRLRSQEVRRPASQEAKRSTSDAQTVEGWDDEMVWKGSHLYTDRERNLFDEIVLKLRERFGLEVQKRLLARAAIRLLADDLQRKGETSFVVSLLTGQVKKWLERVASQEAKRQGGQPPKQPTS